MQVYACSTVDIIYSRGVVDGDEGINGVIAISSTNIFQVGMSDSTHQETKKKPPKESSTWTEGCIDGVRKASTY